MAAAEAAAMDEQLMERAAAASAASYRRFDPGAYLRYNYTPPRADFSRPDSVVPWKLACLHRAFSEGKRPEHLTYCRTGR